MADTDAVLEALEHLDEKGRETLALAGALWEELYREASWRAEKAEWLMGRIYAWACQWGLQFDLVSASEHWDARYARTEPVLASCYHTLLSLRAEEIAKLRERLNDVLDSREQAEIHADIAERECDALRTELARMRAA